MNESQIIGDLHSALDDEARDVHVPPGAAQRARIRGRRRRTARGLLAGVPAVALAAGLVIAAQGHSGPGTRPAGTGAGAAGGTTGRAAGTTTARPKAETAAYVVKQVEAVLANENQYISREVTNSYQGGTYTSWTDPRTGSAYAVQGTGSAKVLSWNSAYFVHRVLHWRTTEADYSTRTWFVSVIHAAGPVQGPLTKPADGGTLTPAELKRWLAAGTMRVVGHGYVNGHHAIELRARLGIITQIFWVDAQTFLPVREIKEFGRGLGGDLVFNDSWIPRTAALVNIANHPQIPAGFTRVPAPR
ncbi:MAG: hypothetical protein ACHP9Z_12555 [Streptosporangiales bacterium]